MCNKKKHVLKTSVPENRFSEKFRKLHWKAQTMKFFFVNQRTPLQVFFWDFYEFFQDIFFTEHFVESRLGCVFFITLRYSYLICKKTFRSFYFSFHDIFCEELFL